MGKPTRGADADSDGGNKICRCLHVVVFALFVVQVVTIYTGYLYYAELDQKCELRYDDLRQLLRSRQQGPRVRRDTSVQDNSILKSPADEAFKMDAAGKNGSVEIVDELMNLKPNFSDKAWIWLNDYSRVPRQQMLELCKVINQNCPTQKGEPGTKGNIGEKGDKGDFGQDGANGLPGAAGPIGPRGPSGVRGDRGEKGDRGWPGLNGRSGIPGEPGLDGIPGRNGKDGIPGKNGMRGMDGTPGIPGRDGLDGIKGEKGEKGTSGPIGPTGLPGKQGKPGNPGVDGIPGTPGITAKNCSVNGTHKLLTPPSIVGSEPNYYEKSKVVNENENVKFKCISTGEPKPRNVWRKIGPGYDEPIKQGQWEDFYHDNEILYFMNVSRKHMGDYMCIANNGIPPSANLTASLIVHFPPYIEIENVILNVTVGGSARLLCKFEAYPFGVYYWEDSRGIIYEQSFDRFQVNYENMGRYETLLELNITNIRRDELGIYYCIGKNDLGITKGYINVTDEPGTQLQVTELCHKNRVKFGNPAPPADGKICPDCPKCKICGFGYRDLEIHTIGNQSYRLPDKVSNCEMETIGKPVYHNSLPGIYGAWMRESFKEFGDYYWITVDNCTTCLYQYLNKNEFTNKTSSRTFNLRDPFVGNDHIIYNGSFYYSTKKNDSIYVIRYDLEKESPDEGLHLPYCDTSQQNYLYKDEKNHIDIMSDENGLWAVCALQKSNNTAVTKINTTLPELRIDKAWNISVKHRDAGDMFIICGILYAVDSVKQYDTKVSLALDLFTEKLLDDVKIVFTNPFMNTSMISYNYKYKELFTWDSGNMLTYPIKCRALENDTASVSNEINVTQLSTANVTREEKPKKKQN